MRRWTRSGFGHTGSPRSSMLPASGRVRPSIISSVVVLPAPFGPRMPNVSPCSTANETPATAWTLPKRLCTSSTRIACTWREASGPSSPAWLGARPRDEGVSQHVAGGGGDGVRYHDARRLVRLDRVGDSLGQHVAGELHARADAELAIDASEMAL